MIKINHIKDVYQIYESCSLFAPVTVFCEQEYFIIKLCAMAK